MTSFAGVDVSALFMNIPTEPTTKGGELSILNCAAGDIRIQFDKKDPEDVNRAKKIIQDMQRRGYIIMVEDSNGEFHRVYKFDDKKNEYLIKTEAKKTTIETITRVARKPANCAKCNKKIEAGESYLTHARTPDRKTHVACGPYEKEARKKQIKRLPMTQTRATGIAPTAGG